jgi:carbonic anhydrase
MVGAGTLGTSLFGYLSTSVSASEPVHWDYSGENGPDHWGELSTEFQTCQLGQQQAPIDLQSPIEANLGSLVVNYSEAPLKLINNGHIIQVNYESGSSMTANGETFNLLQFHFHHPSEHRLNGQTFDMELHLVHQSNAGRMAVIGVMLKSGQANPILQPIWDAIPDQQGPERIVQGKTINANQLLPADRHFYEYYGSLTTPPCSEGIRWFVMAQPLEVSSEQIQRFTALFSRNARPVQPLNNRFVLESQ